MGRESDDPKVIHRLSLAREYSVAWGGTRPDFIDGVSPPRLAVGDATSASVLLARNSWNTPNETRSSQSRTTDRGVALQAGQSEMVI